jgi:hypothetical protein
VRFRRFGSLPMRFPIRWFWEAIDFKIRHKLLILLVTPAGFEPATFSLEGCCSIP